MAARIGIITNLNSRQSRSGTGPLARLQRFAGDDVLVRATRSINEIHAVIEEFVDAGCTCWISDGGDGTLNWLVNEGGDILERRGLWDRKSPFPCLLVPANGGTIDFVARKAGIRGRSDRVIRRIIDSFRNGIAFPEVELPTLEVTGHRIGDPDDVIGFRRLGFATAIGGIGQKFFEKYYERPQPSPWTIIEIAMKTATGHVASLFPVEGPAWLEHLKDHGRHLLAGTRAEVTIDGQILPYEVFQGLHVGAIDVDFGTMKLFPYAGLPGKLHLVAGALEPIEATWKWVWLVAGRPIPGGTWHESPGESMEVRARDGEVLDPVIDGEAFGSLDRLSVRPGPSIRVPRMPGRFGI